MIGSGINKLQGYIPYAVTNIAKFLSYEIVYTVNVKASQKQKHPPPIPTFNEKVLVLTISCLAPPHILVSRLALYLSTPQRERGTRPLAVIITVNSAHKDINEFWG